MNRQPPDGVPEQEVSNAMRQAWRQMAAGQPAQAVAWMARAARMAAGDRAVRFAQAAVLLGAGQAPEAAQAVERLMAGQEFRAGLKLLVLALCAAGAWHRAAAALERFFTRYGFDPALCRAAALVCQHTGQVGWCAPDPDGVLHWGGLPARALPEIVLDGQPCPTQPGGSTPLPAHWRHGREIMVRHAGTVLLGGRPDRAALCATLGAIWPDDRGLAGWAFMPARPDHRPELYLMDGRGRRPVMLRQGKVGRQDSAAGPGLPVWTFHVPWQAMAAGGNVRVVRPDGQDLPGSPLPVGLPAACTVFPAMRGRGMAPVRVPPPAPRCRVVIPVYADRAGTLACIDSVLASLATPAHATTEIMVVDDATPDPDLARALDALAGQGRIMLRRHASNQGYPAAVCTALADVQGHDVVLLNSDTLVAPGWLEEMRLVAYARADTGTVSPLSNDATILTWPDPARPAPLAGGLAAVRRLMEAARRANGGQDVEIPTAHGFCMFIRHDCLRQTGSFRPELFGRGYGEENDFCMRARLAGWRHRAAVGAFVGHAGGVSFASARADLLRRNLWILNRLFPGYDALVAAHIRADPLRAARRRLSVLVWCRGAVAAGLGAAVLLVSHGEGGGVARVVRARGRDCLAAGQLPVVLDPTPEGFVLRDGRPVARWPDLHFAWPADGQALVALLRALGVARVEIHHHLGHNGRARALGRLLALPYDYYVHDYAGLCPRVTLVGPAGRYCGEPDAAGCAACVSVLGSVAGERDVMRLRRDTARELAGARRVIVPSAEVALRLGRYFAHVTPHVQALEEDCPAQSLPQFAARDATPPATGLPPRNGRCRVVIVGGIGLEKGHAIVLAAAMDARARDLPLEFVVVGHTADDAALLATQRVFVTGHYDEADGLALVRGCAGDVGLMPALWPETWCFTLTLLWRAGLRAVAFDIGTVAQRIRATGRGACVPLGLPVHQLNTFLLSYARAGRDVARPACS
ncbi:glycosyltransferase [Komagataeibacter sp. AV436]|uniref:Glycosyltransferase n=1 Tax=Komagataeibacter melomenusus TaxID=2766578 RepID=A0ABX2AE06_9PROT|nr:glycosyltransferase [Komagataeibacter melomenusus]MBV1830592.1 glycosyltransferase [Komagataeibacter melomenusus]NPC66581.1 glycosyltransferase [Komagataeibacter melomenusus]